MKDFLKKLKEDANLLLTIMMVFAVFALLLFFFWAGLVLFFFVSIFIWIVFMFTYFRFLFKFSFNFRILVFIILFIITFFIIYKTVPEKFGASKNSNSVSGEVVNGIKLVPCTKTLNDKPVKISNVKTTLYSAPLENTSPSSDKANNIRTFSLNGINNKTEKNSFYGRFEMADGSTIMGYDEEMEVCNADNKANYNYNVASHNDDTVKENNVTARTHYFHGGKYLPLPGVYRVDYLVKDKADGQWKLVDRVEGITITE